MGKRQESRERIEAQIIALGRRQLATEGAAGLSVRAIARDLGMVSSAVYRYVAGRDELLTMLLADAYGSMNRNDEAAKIYEQYTVMYPTGERIDGSYLNAIDALREAGKYDEANEWIDKTRTRFPGQPTEATGRHSVGAIFCFVPQRRPNIGAAHVARHFNWAKCTE